MVKKLFFQAHWLLGIVASLTLFIIGISGAFLSFQSDIMRWLNPDVFAINANENSPQLSIEEILERVQESNTGSKVTSITIPSSVQESVRVVVSSANNQENHRGISLYVHPYTGEIISELRAQRFFTFMMWLHRRLQWESGGVGKQIVAISTIILVFLSISGVYLYWSVLRKGFLKALIVNFSAKGRGFLYKLHSAIGMWVLVPFLLMSLTGLYWSYNWYRIGLYNIMGVEVPARFRQQPPKDTNSTQAKAQKTNENAIKESKDANNSAKEQPSRPSTPNKSISEIALDVEQAIELAKETIPNGYKTITVQIPKGGLKYSVVYIDLDAAHSRAGNQMSIDLKEGKLLSHTRYDDKPLNEKIMGSMLPIHSGEFFGEVGRWIFFISSTLMPLFVITGWMLYFNRRKRESKKAASKA